MKAMGYFCTCLFIPRHMIVAGYYGFMLDIRVSVHPSVVPSSVCPFFVSVSNFNGVTCPPHDNGEVLYFNVFIFFK